MSHLGNFDSNYDIWFEHSSKKIGYKLAHDDKGNPMITENIATFVAPQISQGSYSYDSTAAEVNVPVAYEDWQGGCGFVFAPSNNTLAKTVYAYASGIDASWPNRLYVSPAKQTGATTTQAPIKFVYSSLGVFCMTTRYVYEWDSSTWTQRLDAGASATLTDLIEFSYSSGNLLVVGVSGNGYYYSSDGINFTQFTGSTVPSFRASATAGDTTAAATSVTVTKPTGTVDNDIMLAMITWKSNTVPGMSPPAGWSNLAGYGSSGTPAGTFYVYWKRASSEGADYTWTWTGGIKVRAVIVTYKDVSSVGTSYDSYTGNNDSDVDANEEFSAATATGDLRLAVAMVSSHDNADSTITHTPPTGYTERVDSNAIISFGVYDKAVSAGSVAATTGTSSTSAYTPTFHIVLTPVSSSNPASDVVRFAVRGQASGNPLLWAVSSTGEMRNSEDPTDASSWSAADTIQMGEPTTIKGLEVIDNIFYLYTKKGITSYDGTTVSTVWNNISLTMEGDAARPYTWVDQRTYFTFSGALYRFDSGQTFIEKVWPHTSQQEEDTRVGTITSITGDSTSIYFTLKNLAGNYILMKCDPYKVYDVGGTNLMPAFDINEFSTNACGAMIVVPGASDTLHTTNPQLVYGYGTNANYLILTRNGALPSDDSNYRFDTGTGTIIGAYSNAGARLFPKFANSATFIAASADANTTGVLSVDTLSLTGASVTTSVATGTTSSGPISGNITSDIQFSDIRYNLTMDSNTNTTPYQVRGIVINTSLNPTRMRMWNITVEIAEELERIGGGDSSYGAHYLADHLFNGLTQRVSYYDRGGTVYVTRILDVKGQHVGRDKIVYNIIMVQLY